MRKDLRFRQRVWLPSTERALEQAVARVRRLAIQCCCPEDRLADLEIAVREAMANAIQHGNGTRPRRKIFLRCYGGPDVGIFILVRDQGNGFDPDAVPDPRRADRMHLHHGRGLLIMRGLMDHVEYRKGGREVLLFRARRSTSQDE